MSLLKLQDKENHNILEEQLFQKENINSKKDLMKCIIFNINLKLYYEIFNLKQRIVS